MAAIVLLLQVTFICCATWVLWCLLRSFFVPSPFDNIPGPPPSKSWIKGHYAQLFDRNGWEFQRELGEKYGPVVKINGLFGQLYVFDPVALHHIIVKDQYIYEETSTFITSNSLLFGKGLLATLGDHHRRQRKLLNPVFSINNMRHMLPIFYKISGSLRNAIAAKLDDGPKEIDILNWMCRTALELIGQGGLGYSFDPLVHDVANPYGDAMKSLGPMLFPMYIMRQLMPILARIGPPAFRRRVVELIPYKPYQRVLEIVDVMDTRSKEVFYAKKAAMEKGDEAVLAQFGEGRDIMSRLLQANMAASVEDKLSDDELLGQMSSLIFAAMDTTATGLSHILNLLAEHQDVQEKLRREVTEARDNRGDIPYDELVDLPYLDAVCRETLRLYAPVSFVSRTTRKDIVLPLGSPITGRDGTLIHEIPIPNNTNIIIAILASNRNPALWGPDAHEWKPERWLTALPATVGEARVPGIYTNLLTFLGGGRACIGFKFSQMEMKVVLSVLLESFKFSLPKERLVWNFAGIQYPSAGDDPKPRLPMKVELVKFV